MGTHLGLQAHKLSSLDNHQAFIFHRRESEIYFAASKQGFKERREILLTVAISIITIYMDSSEIVTGIVPEFTETFILTQKKGSYKKFIEGLRNLLQSGRFAGRVPLLNQEQDNQHKWFHIVIRSGDSQITLRLRYGNVYLVAFQGANGQWYEFQPHNDNPPLFSNSVVLPYTSDYPRDKTAFAQNTVVGATALARAISSLASPNFNPRNGDNHQLLINLMIMLPEAIRFRTVSDFVNAQMHNPNTPDSKIGTRIEILVHTWGALSYEMRRSDLHASFRELPEIGISSADDAASLLGILLWSSKIPTISEEASEVLVTSKGRKLVEIFSVKILNIDNENPNHLYGKIQVSDRFGTPQYIFDRTKDNMLSIGPQDYVPLTGPTRAISAYHSFYIDVSLMDNDALSRNDEVSNRQLIWSFSDKVYNKQLSAQVKGKYGSIDLSYAVYSNAVTATVQVKLINANNKNTAGIYGNIKASNNLSCVFIDLFHQDDNGKFVDVKPLELIPLLRSVVVVPRTSSITVCVDLWDGDQLSGNCAAIAQGSITFKADTSVCNTGRISGEYGECGEVEVMVTWSSSSS